MFSCLIALWRTGMFGRCAAAAVAAAAAIVAS